MNARDVGSDPGRILVVLPTWVGDFVMATPTLRALRRRYNSAHIAFLAHSNLEDLIQGGDWMDEVILWNPKRGKGRMNPGVVRLAGALRGRSFDWAVLLSNSFRSAALVWLAGIRRRIGYGRDGRSLLLTDRLRAPRSRGAFVSRPMVEYYGVVAEYLGCPPPGDRLELFTTPEDERRVNERLKPLGLADHHPLVVIAPGASFGASKCWLPERFAALGDRLIEEQGAGLVITCGPGEEAIGEAITASMSRSGYLFTGNRKKGAENREESLTLGELKALIRRSDLLICNDIGPRHFAKAFGIPVVTLFGPTDPAWTDTSYPRERRVLVPVDCGPCQQKICPLGHHKCMTGISVEMVFQACVEMMGTKVSRGACLTAR